jgi:hypothetical protein
MNNIISPAGGPDNDAAVVIATSPADTERELRKDRAVRKLVERCAITFQHAHLLTQLGALGRGATDD